MTKKIIPLRIEASTQSDDKALLFLHGVVGSFYDGITFNKVREILADFQGNEIEVHINSYGGDLFEGIAIKNYLLQRSEMVTVVIDGLAASAASVIAMCGDKILMPKDTQMMIHNPWTYAAGNAKELRKIADDLDKMQESLEETYLERFKGERSELIALLDEETFLTANEAVALGLSDGIYGGKVDEPEEEAQEPDEPVIQSLMAKYGTAEQQKESKQTLERFAFLFAPETK